MAVTKRKVHSRVAGISKPAPADLVKRAGALIFGLSYRDPFTEDAGVDYGQWGDEVVQSHAAKDDRAVQAAAPGGGDLVESGDRSGGDDPLD
jgi:hypothetical protein